MGGIMQYPYRNDAGDLVWACCESNIGPVCEHRRMDNTYWQAIQERRKTHGSEPYGSAEKHVHAEIVRDMMRVQDKRILFPDALRLEDVAHYVGPYVSEPDPEHTGRQWRTGVDIGGNTLSQYANFDMSQLGGPRHYAIRLEPTEEVVSVLRRELVTDDDVLSWQIIGHKDTGLALVIVKHGQIIGSRWIAYVDPSSVPTP